MAAFVSGGYLPQSARGTHCDGMISVADWYGTLARLAGDTHPVDVKAANAGLPPIDSLDVWPLVTGANTTSPRTVLPVDTETILVGSHKLILTAPDFAPHAKRGIFVAPAGWVGPAYPNRSTLLPHRDAGTVKLNCSGGCLFDVVC